jgi:aryl-phospho-beta-D-glucosidase BglC (GH1 family)
MKKWFEDPKFPLNLRDLWNKHFGFIVKQNIAPVFIGEFGATFKYASALVIFFVNETDTNVIADLNLILCMIVCM